MEIINHDVNSDVSDKNYTGAKRYHDMVNSCSQAKSLDKCIKRSCTKNKNEETLEKKSSFQLKSYLASRKELVESVCEHVIAFISKGRDTHRTKYIMDSMKYSLLAGGKRIRPILCMSACELFGGSYRSALPIAAAVELVHTMSLIHDDLPCMDNDNLRRGIPTNHKVFGESVAILAGDALLSTAFEIISDQVIHDFLAKSVHHENAKNDTSTKSHFEYKAINAEKRLQIISRLGKAVGVNGLAGGQVMDLKMEGKMPCNNISVGLNNSGPILNNSHSNKVISEHNENTTKHSTIAPNTSTTPTGSCCVTSDSTSNNNSSNSSMFDDLNWIHMNKTAALLKFSISAGAIVADAPPEDVDVVESFAEKIGIAFQIIDDVLDVTGTVKELGKTPNKDSKSNKLTYVTLLGLEKSREEAKRLIVEAKSLLYR